MKRLAALSMLSIAGVAHAQVAPPPDRDGDRVRDEVDLCPDAAETGARLFAGDGCPDTDGDHDGIVDDYDACPGAAEDVNGQHDLDGCPDASAPAPPDASRIGCWQGEALVDLTSVATLPQLMPRADAPIWMGTSPLDCYAHVAFDGREALHCASADGVREATLVWRTEGSRGVGVVAFRTADRHEVSTGVVRERGPDAMVSAAAGGTPAQVRAWRATRQPDADPQVVLDAIAAHAHDILGCYERELQRSPGLTGRVVLRVTLTPSGELTDVAVVTSALGRPDVEACMVAAVDAISVTAPPRCGARTIRVPFVLEPEPP